jgi:hypothetical protein
LGVVSGVCAAQQLDQFINQPRVWPTGGRVTSLLTGSFQNPSPGGTDILYINAATGSGPTSSVLVGEELYEIQYSNQTRNMITFSGATNVAAALGDFDGDRYTDYAFAISGVSTNNLCVYYGTGAPGVSASGSYDGGNVYPPTGGKSGCMTLPTQTTNPSLANPPIFSYIAAPPFTTNGLSQLLVEDSANNLLYVFSNSGTTGKNGKNGKLPGFTPLQTIQIPPTDGPGPIYSGYFDKNGNPFFIINGQTGHSATVYTGDGSGVFTKLQTYSFTKGVYSMLLQDMDNDRIPDMVVEGKDGSIEIFEGDGYGNFTTPLGGTAAGLNALTGNGGHLAAIDPNSLNILTTTPIGLSVLQNDGSSSLNYTLKGIYNIGPGRSSVARGFFGESALDLAVDSPEGVAIIPGNADGSFQASLAYSAQAPALGATMGQFRPLGNPLDVVVATGTGAGAVQAQWLKGNGNGTFAAPVSTNTSAGPSGIPNGLWSNILSGDFNGDGKLDLAYSLTGLPLPTGGTGLYVQYGNGDGTFQAPLPVFGASSGNTLYGESTVGTFNSGANAGIANIDANFDDTLLGQSSNTFNVGLNQPETNTGFNQVAAGTFKTGSSYQDLVFQNGANLVPYVNSGDGIHFTPKIALTGPSPAANYAISAVLLTDVNGDGNGDIVALYHNLFASDLSNPSPSTPNWLYIWFGDGNGNFDAPQKVSLSRNFYLAAVVDMNGDALPDIVLSDGYVVCILYNLSGGIFQSDFNTCGGGKDCDEAHFLAGQGINSLSLENVRGGTFPVDLVVANGGATISNAVALEGASASSISLTPNPVDLNTGGITVLANNITARQTTGMLTSSPLTSTIGEAFNIIATLTSSSGLPFTGWVTFYIDNTTTPVCTVSLTASTGTTTTAQCPIATGNSYQGGTLTLTATYSGDPNNAVATLFGTHNIQGIATNTALALCIGGSLNCPVTGAPTGTLTVVPSLSMTYGQVYNGTETVTDQDGSAFAGTGTIDFYQDNVLLCTLQASSTIPCPPNVGTGTPAGIHTYDSVYSGDSTYIGSTSNQVTITVTPDTPAATVTSSLNPAPSGQAVTLTATLLGANAPLGTAASPVGLYVPPTGTVVFMNGSTVLCSPSVALAPSSTGVSSTATCTTSNLPVGVDQITASYAVGQDINFNGATSAAFPETITKVNTTDFTVSATPNPASVGVGYAALLTVTVAVYNGFAEGVNLTCGNLPNEATCTFAPAAIASGGGASQLFVLTAAPHSCGTTEPYFLGGNGGGPHLAPFALPALAGLVAFLIPGKRRWLRALMALIVVAGIAQMTGCSTCTDLGTKPATYTFQVIGTSAGTGEVQSQTVKLNITI